MSAIETKLREHGFELPPVAAPVASYIPAQRTGNLVFTSGQLPTVEGKLIAEGILGVDVDEEAGLGAANNCDWIDATVIATSRHE